MKEDKKKLFFEAEKFVKDEITKHPKLDLLMQGESIVSFSPPEFLWGYTYHSHCIPPFRPESVLILGYGKGQIAHLIRKIYDNGIKVTGVDILQSDILSDYIEYDFKCCDALDYVRVCTNTIVKTRFDYIVIDLFDGEKVPNFVFSTEFALCLKEMTKKLLCINVISDEFHKLKPFSDYSFKFHRLVPIFGNTVSFWSP